LAFGCTVCSNPFAHKALRKFKHFQCRV
jgi:hypothetical protein